MDNLTDYGSRNGKHLKPKLEILISNCNRLKAISILP